MPSNNLVLNTAINTLVKLLKKYKKNEEFNFEQLVEDCSKLQEYGSSWYSAYCENCRLADKDFLYSREYDDKRECERIIDEMEANTDNILPNSQVCLIIAKSKMLQEKLAEKSSQGYKFASELSEKISQYEAECDQIRISYEEAEISPSIIEQFVRNQSSKYCEMQDEIKAMEAKLGSVETKSNQYVSDKNEIETAIKTIEDRCYLKYTDPDDNKEYPRYTYRVKIEKLLTDLSPVKK